MKTHKMRVVLMVRSMKMKSTFNEDDDNVPDGYGDAYCEIADQEPEQPEEEE
jgi:hypothetical protein